MSIDVRIPAPLRRVTNGADKVTVEAENLFRCVETDDHMNSIAAFLEKRNPEFKGSQ